mmetsp:Transcript_10965/g.44445  ORF Transcript_10965/g.44445 Transcript_10965/m.44445 type:complete len:342 (+) Transcript_10965:349-1374(+)
MSSPNGTSSMTRMHSRHMVQSRGRRATARCTTPPEPSPESSPLLSLAGGPTRSSRSNTSSGQRCLSATARSPTTSCTRSTRGSIRYDAVATGENLAWSLPMPLRPWASSDTACPGRSLVMEMSSCTGRAGSSLRKASWSPCGSHLRSAVVIRVVCFGPPGRRSASSSGTASVASSLRRGASAGSSLTGARTSSPNTMVFTSVASSGSTSSSNSFGSTRKGMSPSRWARTSSCMTPVFSSMYTDSIAIVGTSAIMMRRNAFASDTSTPTSSNSTSSSVDAVTSILSFDEITSAYLRCAPGAAASDEDAAWVVVSRVVSRGAAASCPGLGAANDSCTPNSRTS